MTGVTRRVTSSDGVGIAVHESGDPVAPTIVAVHGYPDNHTVWDGVVNLLADRFHVVAYDVRGCGASDKPGRVSEYRMERLVDDFRSVIDAVSPDSPVHVLAHDWGSIQSWPAVLDERTAGRVASFTSISGPSLDYAGSWLRQFRRHPRAVLTQLAHSYYIALLQLPGLPEAAARRGLLDRALAAGARGGRSTAVDAGALRTEADKVNGISLYRANMVRRLGSPAPKATALPVQVIVADQDAYVTPALAAGAPAAWVEHLTVHAVSGGHWVVSEQPDVIARLTAEFVDRHRVRVPSGSGSNRKQEQS